MVRLAACPACPQDPRSCGELAIDRSPFEISPVVVLSRPESPSISYGDLTPVEVVKLPNTDLPA